MEPKNIQMNIIESARSIKRNNSLPIYIINLIILLITGCSHKEAKIELRDISDSDFNIREKGVTINGQKEGYWVTFNHAGILEIECAYHKDKLNGPIIYYYSNGTKMKEGFMMNNSSNGLWKSYYLDGQIKDSGNISNGFKDGIWSFYMKDGRLNKKVLYRKDKSQVLINNHLEPDIPDDTLSH